jgi:hypothetical protein
MAPDLSKRFWSSVANLSLDPARPPRTIFLDGAVEAARFFNHVVKRQPNEFGKSRLPADNNAMRIVLPLAKAYGDRELDPNLSFFESVPVISPSNRTLTE